MNNPKQSISSNEKHESQTNINMNKGNGSFDLFNHIDQENENNKDIVLHAVKNNGLLLEFASFELRNDKEIVLEAYKQNIFSVKFIGEKLKNDIEFVSLLKNDLQINDELKKLRGGGGDDDEAVDYKKDDEKIDVVKTVVDMNINMDLNNEVNNILPRQMTEEVRNRRFSYNIIHFVFAKIKLLSKKKHFWFCVYLLSIVGIIILSRYIFGKILVSFLFWIKCKISLRKTGTEIIILSNTTKEIKIISKGSVDIIGVDDIDNDFEIHAIYYGSKKRNFVYHDSNGIVELNIHNNHNNFQNFGKMFCYGLDLKVFIKKGRKIKMNINVNIKNHRLTINNADFDKNSRIETQFGNIYIQESGFRDIEFDTSYSDVEIETIKVNGDMKMKFSYGDVNCKSLNLNGSVSIDQSYTDIEFDESVITGDIDINCRYGDIVFDNTEYSNVKIIHKYSDLAFKNGLMNGNLISVDSKYGDITLENIDRSGSEWGLLSFSSKFTDYRIRGINRVDINSFSSFGDILLDFEMSNFGGKSFDFDLGGSFCDVRVNDKARTVQFSQFNNNNYKKDDMKVGKIINVDDNNNNNNSTTPHFINVRGEYVDITLTINP